jgi:hypothetical protein
VIGGKKKDPQDNRRSFSNVQDLDEGLEAAAGAAAVPTTETAASTGALAATTTPGSALSGGTGCRLVRQQAFPLQLLASELAGAAHGLGLFASSLFRWFLEMSAELHLAEDALTLQLFLECLESLINVVIANENLQAVESSENFLLSECTKTPAPAAWPPEPALVS